MGSLEEALTELSERIRLQEERLRRLAAQVDPRLSWEDCLQPHDHPGLATFPAFQYEDGVRAGLEEAVLLLRRWAGRPD